MLSVIDLQASHAHNVSAVPTAPHFLRDTFVPDAKKDDAGPQLRPLDELTVEEEQAHQLPTFNESHGEQEVLYLPPLLSSLPKEHEEEEREHDHDHDHDEHEDDSSDWRKHPKETPLRTATHLPSIDPVSLSLHRALHKFKPYDSKYASKPYAESFNWAQLHLPLEEEREWYCVAFRSRRKAGSESAPLYEQDRLAHEEAVRNGGLIMYWYGVPDPISGLNLATCIWQSRKFALAANSGPQHRKAMVLAAASFAEFRLERYILRKEAGEHGLKVFPYISGDVGW